MIRRAGELAGELASLPVALEVAPKLGLPLHVGQIGGPFRVGLCSVSCGLAGGLLSEVWQVPKGQGGGWRRKIGSMK